MNFSTLNKQIFLLLFAFILANNLIAQKANVANATTAEENVLRIKAENNWAVSYAVIGFREGASNDYVRGEDVQKLFSPYNYVPEVYSLVNDYPVDINFINHKEVITVPLGVKTDRAGNVQLTFTGMDYYFRASKIEFIDNEGQTIDITGRESFTYTFNHTGTGIQNGRFSIRFGVEDLSINLTVNGENYSTMNEKLYCNTYDFVFKAVTSIQPISIIWKLNGEEIPGSRDGITVNLNAPAGYCTLDMNYSGWGVSGTLSTHFYAGKASLVWTPEANAGGSDTQKQDWNTPNNWTPAIVPTSCYDVYIPGNSTHYPNLTSPAECNDIYFIQGAELGHPNRLTYSRAHTQLNFGVIQHDLQQVKNSDKNLVLKSSATADRMQYSAAVSPYQVARERWYMLSSPLRGVVTGDLSFGGFPLTFLKKFNLVKNESKGYTVGDWTTLYTSLIEKATANPTDGFAFYMYGFDNEVNSTRGCYEYGSFNDLNDLDYLPSSRSGKFYGIKETNGILELPFFEDQASMNAHRTQVYDAAGRTSMFYYASYDASGENLNGTVESLTREEHNGNYRFVPEKFNGSSWYFDNPIYHPTDGWVDDGNGVDFLVGNPYMSSLDMVKFCKNNESSVEPTFKIWNGYTFVSYKVDLGLGYVLPANPNDSPYIAPFQGFFLKYKGGQVRFDVNEISIARPYGSTSNLRSAEAEENILRIKAEKNNYASYALIGYKEGASNDFVRDEDVQKLFSPYDYVPEIYALASEIPVDIDFINNHGELIVPLGIKIGQPGEIQLTFSGMDKYLKTSKIELIDALENRTIDLTGQSSVSYTINHQEKGIQNGRLSIRFGKSPTVLPNIYNSNDLKIYSASKGLYVISPSSSDPVQQVIIYDFQGRKVYENTSGATYYSLHENFGDGPMIVKVVTKNRVKTVKIK